jgi:transcriptional regulator with XRE-family HTH domain
MSIPKRQRIYPSLRAWRREQRLTQEAAAEFLGVSQGFYSKLERGAQFPDRLNAKRISDQAGVPLEAVMGLS